MPEEWERAEQNKQNMLNIFIIIVALIFLCLMLFALYIIYKQNKSFLFSKRLFWILSGIVFTIVTVDFINSWQTITAGFNTSLPINDQLFQTITAMSYHTKDHINYPITRLLQQLVYALGFL